jgi:hypothetical protein
MTVWCAGLDETVVSCNSNFHALYTSAKTKQKHTVWAERRFAECWNLQLHKATTRFWGFKRNWNNLTYLNKSIKIIENIFIVARRIQTKWQADRRGDITKGISIFYVPNAQKINSLEKKTHINVKVQKSLNRPGQAMRVPESWGSQISRQSAHDSGKAAFTPPGNIPSINFY